MWSFPNDDPTWAPIAVSCLDDCFGWCEDALNKIIKFEILPDGGLDALTSSEELCTSTAFSGIGSSETADDIITNATITAAGRPLLKNCPLWAVEKDKKCLEELLVLPSTPRHIFTDIFDFVPKKHRTKFGMSLTPTVGQTVAAPAQTLRKMISAGDIRMETSAWCARCGSVCEVRESFKHAAGSPCTDLSTFGKRLLFEGGELG